MDKPTTKIITLRSQREGAGFIIRRSIGCSQTTTQETDPFLMLDELPLTNYAPGEFPGAPWHPHRGMDTVMYVKKGTCGHEDSMGNKGVLTDGDCQWMTAASGLEHNEGTGHPGGPLHGFQMWINLPKAHKMDPPAYNDISAATIPVANPAPGITVKVVAGECNGVNAVVQPIVPIQYIDFMCEAGAKYSHAIPDNMKTAIVHVYKGSGTFGSDKKTAKEGQCLFMGAGSNLVWEAGSGGVSFLLLAGQPIKEPVVWHGPFVANTQAEIQQAFRDYQTGNFIKHKAVYRRL